MRHSNLLITAALFIAPAIALAQESTRTIDCYCTDRYGDRVELGETICLTVDNRAFLARCEMSLNNPMWRDLGEGCLSSGTGGPAEFRQPLPHSRPVHTKI